MLYLPLYKKPFFLKLLEYALQGKLRLGIFIVLRQPKVRGCLGVQGFEPQPSDYQPDVMTTLPQRCGWVLLHG